MLIIFDLDDTLFQRLPDNYTEEDVNNLEPYPGVRELLIKNDYKKFLVSKGDPEFQNQKLNALKIKELFDSILICSDGEMKKECFADILKKFPEENVWVVGDRIDLEIRFGNELGFKTVLLKKGKYKDLKAKDDLEIPDYKFVSFAEINHFFEHESHYPCGRKRNPYVAFDQRNS